MLLPQLAILLAYMFASAGAVLYSVSESVHRIVLDGLATVTDVYTLVQFTGTLAVAVFSVSIVELLDHCSLAFLVCVRDIVCVNVCTCMRVLYVCGWGGVWGWVGG